MKKDRLSWFSLSNYEPLSEFKAEDWMYEIEKRIFMEPYINEFENKDKTKLNNWRIEDAFKTYMDIKEFGLLTNKDTNQRNTNVLMKQKDTENIFVKNLLTDRALAFLETISTQQEFRSDYSELNNSEHEKRMKLYPEFTHKYSKPISTYMLEDLNAFEQRNKYVLSSDEGERFLEVDINASDEILIEEFKRWLKEERQNYPFASKDFTRKDFFSWQKDQLLAYWDITIISKIEKFKVTNEKIGNLLFPKECEVAISDRIRKVIKPKSQKIISYNVYCALESQAKVE